MVQGGECAFCRLVGSIAGFEYVVQGLPRDVTVLSA